MCGIAGIYHWQSRRDVDKKVLKRMVDSLVHRGPDEDGYYIRKNVGMGMRRLSIIDLSTGTQPIFNETKEISVVFNGELYNYVELREQLIKKGHRFYTTSDTEVIVHLYEEYGPRCVTHLNGQFAIALRDEKKDFFMLARDRVGIRPLFYADRGDGTLLFGSETKAILANPEIEARIDPVGLQQVFTFWANIPPRTVF
ncbi:MAG: asparagine synthetase B, partial [bacterium]|nr:asparagine synthetase B [bacterium]